MAGGIKIVVGGDIKVIDCGFSGLDFGIDAENCKDLVINRNHFNDVTSPVKVKNFSTCSTMAITGYFKCREAGRNHLLRSLVQTILA